MTLIAVLAAFQKIASVVVDFLGTEYLGSVVQGAVAAGMVSLFRKHFPNVWARMEAVDLPKALKPTTLSVGIAAFLVSLVIGLAGGFAGPLLWQQATGAFLSALGLRQMSKGRVGDENALAPVVALIAPKADELASVRTKAPDAIADRDLGDENG